jgi:hypothetical protein
MKVERSGKYRLRSPGSVNKIVVEDHDLEELRLALLVEYAWLQNAIIPGTMVNACGYVIQFSGIEENMYTLNELEDQLLKARK